MMLLLPVLWLLFSCLPAFAADIDVDNKELEAARRMIDFENNRDLPPPGTWNSLEEIRAIGAKLGRELLEERGKPYVVVGDKKRYLLKEVLPDHPKGGGLSADILELGALAGVDSIRNLRLIIAGYLETAYSYDRAYAEELAVYITVYNALYREKLDFFIERYSKPVISQLKKNRLGLSRSFRDWPGNTQIVVPLHHENGAYIPEVEIKAVLEKEVVAAVEKEKPGATAAMESLVVKERSAARTAADEAEKKKNNLGGALKRAQEKEDDLGPRIKKMKEEIETIKGELVTAQKDIVKNKFGQPIQGNETAKKIEEDLKKRTETLKNMEKEYREAQVSARELETQLKDAEDAAEKRKGEAERLGA